MLTLSNPGHTSALLKSFGMDKSSSNKTPMAQGVYPMQPSCNPLPVGNRYAELIGSLLYLASTSRPDISFAVGYLARYMATPETTHMAAAKGILRYLKGTSKMGLVYDGIEPLHGLVDADYAGDQDTRKSTTGYVFTPNGGPICWVSKRKSSVATSTAEAEYVAAAMATKEAIWLTLLLKTLEVEVKTIHIGEDNQACLAMLQNPQMTGRSKHIDVFWHFVREHVKRGDVEFHYLPSGDMPADGLTKPLAPIAFKPFRERLGMGEAPNAEQT